MNADPWRVLRETGDGTVVLAVDFGTGRAQAGFGDLVPLLGGAFGVWDTPGTGPSADADPDTATDPAEWVGRHVGALAGVTVRGVVGYCSGAALAVRLTSSMASGDPAPTVVLADPVVVHPHLLAEYFLASFHDWRQQVPPGTLDPLAPNRVRAAADRTAALLPGTLGYLPLMEAVCAEYQRACAAVGDQLGLDSDFVAEMCDHMRSFTAYLVTCARVGTADLGSRSRELAPVTLASASHRVPAEFAGRPVRFDVPRTRMLGDAAVAAWITEALVGGRRHVAAADRSGAQVCQEASDQDS